MKVSRLRRVLADLGSILTSAGAKKPAEDVARLAQLMAERDHQLTSSFIDELRSDLTPLTSDEIVTRYLVRFRKAALDESGFRRVLRALAADKDVKKAQANGIAHGYIGGRKAWPTKAAALEAIEREFVSRSYDASKMKEVARSRPW